METDRDETGTREASASRYLAYPILSLSDVLSLDLILTHLDSLLPEQLAEYRDYLPHSVEPTKEEIMRVVRTGFFHQSNKELSSTIANNGVGQILAQSFGYSYKGEGLEAFLRGIREISKKEKEDKEE